MDITDTLNPVIIYSTLTASCALKKNLTFSKTKWIISLIGLLLNITVMAAMLNAVNIPRAQDFNEKTNVQPIHTLTKICNRGFVFAAGMVNQLQILMFLQRDLVNVAQTLLHVDDVLKTSDEQHKKDRRIIWCYLICSLSSLMSGLYYSYFLYISINLTVSVFYALSDYINKGVSSSDLQYIALCQIIRSRFILINTKIKNLKKRLKNEPQDFAKELELLRKTHLTLTQLAERTNSIYNVRLFFSFMCYFMNTLTNLYFVIFGETDMNKFDDGAKGFRLIVVPGVGALYNIARLTMLCLASEWLCKEANSSRWLVSKMARYACNAGLKHEVMLFIGILSLTQINLKVARLAKMEVKLIVQVIAYAITVLVTLAQIPTD